MKHLTSRILTITLLFAAASTVEALTPREAVGYTAAIAGAAAIAKYNFTCPRHFQPSYNPSVSMMQDPMQLLYYINDEVIGHGKKEYEHLGWDANGKPLFKPAVKGRGLFYTVSLYAEAVKNTLAFPATVAALYLLVRDGFHDWDHFAPLEYNAGGAMRAQVGGGSSKTKGGCH